MKKMIFVFNHLKLLKAYNTLENKYNALLHQTKEDLFKQAIEAINRPYNIAYYKKENKRLRKIVKNLKEQEKWQKMKQENT